MGGLAGLRRWMRSVGIGLMSCALAVSQPAAAQPSMASSSLPAKAAPWPMAPFTYYADGKSLREVLTQFAAIFSLSVDLPPGLNTSVSGRFSLNTPTEFIDRLAGIYGFNWFTHAGTLYVSSNRDVQVRSIASASSSAGGTSLRQILSDLRILDPRFGWAEVPEQGLVVVSGPPAYVQLVESTAASLPRVPGGLQVAVFRLKHASVEDRVVTYRDREITTPGVANIVRNLMMGGGDTAAARLGTTFSNAGSGYVATAPIVSEPLRGLMPAEGGGGGTPFGGGRLERGERADRADRGNSGAGQLGPRVRPSIQADPRINAIIVQDSPDRIPVYRQLIESLDVPTPLIEIEALIIDVSVSRLDELGINWAASFRNGGLVLGYGNPGAAPPTSNTLSLISGPGSNANLGNLIANTAANFIARLRFLEQQGDASIQARPSILTTENVGAIIDLSETVYIQTTSERTALVTPVTAGTTLRVTPRVVVGGEDPVVRLTVDLEDGQIQNPTAVGALPSVRRGTVSTEAAVRREESLLLGGYNSVQAIKGRDAVPGLGDLPVISPLFSNTQQQVQRRERLFLIRSRVVGSLPAVADAATPATAAAAVVKPVAVPPPAPLTPTAVESSPVIAPGEGLGPAPLPLTPTTPVGQTPVPQALPPATAAVPEVAPRPSTRAENARQREQESIRALEAALDRAEKSLQYYRERLSTGFNAASQDERDARSITRAVAERARAEVELLRSEIASRRAREPAPN